MALASALRWKVAAPTEPHASSQDRPNPPKMDVQVVLAESALALLMLVAPQLHPSVEMRWREVIPNLLAYLKVRISLPKPPLRLRSQRLGKGLAVDRLLIGC